MFAWGGLGWVFWFVLRWVGVDAFCGFDVFGFWVSCWVFVLVVWYLVVVGGVGLVCSLMVWVGFGCFWVVLMWCGLEFGHGFWWVVFGVYYVGDYWYSVGFGWVVCWLLGGLEFLVLIVVVRSFWGVGHGGFGVCCVEWFWTSILRFCVVDGVGII